MRRSRLLIALVLGLAAVLAAGLAIASADEPPDRVVTRFDPGDNQILWQHDALTVQELFDALPQVVLVYKWDANLSRWLVAAPALPKSLWTLHEIAPDADLFVRVEASTPVLYVSERPLPLGPNTHYAGWVAEPITTQALFEAMPGLDTIYAWNATDRHWTSASRADLGSLLTIYPGMGLRLQRDGEQPSEQERPLTPARGLVELYAGDNLISWAGSDGATIEEVVKGIGKTFVQARMWNAEEQRFYIYSALDAELADAFPPVMRGDALWITVSRRTNWLQPTGVLPELIFAGNVSQDTRNDAMRDLKDTLAYVAEVFGVQADPSILVGLIAGDAVSFFDALASLGRAWELEAARIWYEQAGGFGGPELFFVKAPFWELAEGQRYPWARQVILEEYFHGLQSQLAGDFAGQRPTWLVEGSAAWIRADLRTRDGSGLTLSQELNRIRNEAPHGPSLQEIEESNQLWQYTFGLIAADLLVQRAGAPALLDFFRALVPGRTGTKGQWTSQLSWEAAFATTYGLSVEEFYAEFDAHIQEYQGSAPRRARSGEIKLTGNVVDSRGVPLEGIWLQAIEFEHGQRTPYGFAQAKVDDNGEFSIFVNERADYRIQVELADHFRCRFWWTSDGDSLASLQEDADLIKVETSAPSPLTIVVDADKCRWRLGGVLYGPDDEPLPGIQVQAQNGGDWTSARTDAEGSFTITVPEPGQYRVSTRIDGCTLYYKRGGAVTKHQQATRITINDRNVTNVNFRLRSGQCSAKITGRLLDADGQTITDANVWAQNDDGSSWARTDSGGSFSITLPEHGRYRVSARVDGCTIYYRPGGTTALYRQATQIRVSDSDVSDVTLQVAQGMCEHRISGKLLNADGSPRSGQWVSAGGNAGGAGASTAADGSFSFAVPANGSCRLSVWIDGCSIIHGSRGPVKNWSSASQVRVSNADVTGIEFRLPEDPSTFCN